MVDPDPAAVVAFVDQVVRANPEHFALMSLSLEAALRRISARGLHIDTVIDVGASDGRWAEIARPFFPKAHFHMIEANPVFKDRLCEFARQHGYTAEMSAAGDRVGQGRLYSDQSDPFGGAVRGSTQSDGVLVPMTTIDFQVQKLGRAGPCAIKLDTHGFEREILAGARETLERTELLVIEMYNFQSEHLRFAAMVQSVESLGFRCVDISEPLFRDYDKALWQMDFFFLKATRPEFSYHGYR